MPPKINKNDRETSEQALECARIERNRAQKSLSDILCFAKVATTDFAKREQLAARIKRLDNLFSQFQAEQTVIINSLVMLGRSD